MQGSFKQLVIIRQPAPGTFTAEAVGLPEVSATAGTAQAAVREVREQLAHRLSSGQLVQVEFRPAAPPPRDPNDPLEQEFLADLERGRREEPEPTPADHEP